MAEVINDRYRILSELGSGGMSRVLLAEDMARHDTRVALKIVGPPDAPASDKILSEALISEFETLAGLRHPNLPQVHDFGRIPARQSLFLSMEYIEGQELLDAAASMTPAETLSVLAQVCRALEFIHTRALVHGDVKPQNVLVTHDNGKEPRAVLVDFGLVARARSSGQLRGTLHYAAPEVLLRATIDRRADLYSLGVMLYRLTTGRCPFDGKSSDVIRAILEGTPAPPLDALASAAGDVGEGGAGAMAPPPLSALLDEALSALILKLLEKDPARRFRSAAETLHALNLVTGSHHPIETPDTGDAYSTSASLVGRQSEMAGVEAILDRLPRRVKEGLPARESALVVVTGEAGSGRSRFLAEVRRGAQKRGIVAVSVSCDSDAPAFQAVDEALGLLAAGRLARPDAAAPAASSEGARLRIVDGAATALALRASSEPVALFVDDAHLADEGTAAVIESLARDPGRAPGLLLVLSCRSEELEGTALAESLARLRSAVRVEEISLSPLGPGHIREMLEGMLGLAEAPAELVDLVQRETSGNPLFIEQAVHSLLEDGTISRVGTGFRADVDALTKISFAAGVGEAIRRRLDRLGLDERAVLSAMAVIGRPAYSGLIEAASGLEKARVTEALRALMQRRLIVGKVDGELGVASARTRDVVYEGVEWEQRRAMHRSIGEALQRLEREGSPVRHEDLARHFIHGAEPETALRYALEAAEASRRLGAPAEARSFYRRALDLLPQGAEDRRADVLLRLGRIDRELGRDEQALDAFEQALRAAGAATRRDLAGLARLEKADVHLRRGRSEEVAREVELALQLLSLAGDAALVSRANNYLASSHARAGRLERALDIQKRALHAAEQAGEPGPLASAFNNLGLLHCFQGNREAGLASLERAIALRRESGDRHGELETRINLGTRLAEGGDLEKAIECFEQAVALARSVEDLRALVESQLNLGVARVSSGQHDLAASSFEQAAAVAIRIGDDLRAAYSLDAWGTSLRTIGDLEAATRRHGEALDRARRCGDPAQELFILGSLALDHTSAGEAAKARDCLRRAARIPISKGQPRARIRLLEAEARAALVDNAPAEAATKAGEMMAAAEEAHLPVEKARALLILGQARETAGEAQMAAAAFRECLDTAVDPQTGEIRWRALAALARLARAEKDVETARAMATASRAIVDSLAASIVDGEVRSRYLADRERQALSAFEKKEATTAPVAAAGGGLALGAVYRISEIITSAADLDHLLSRVLDLALEIVRAERGLIILVDEEGERQAVRAARGVEPETIADALEYSHSVVREAAAGRTMVMLDSEDDRSFKRFRSVSLFQIKSLACVPIKVRDRILGTVYLDSRNAGYLFRDEDVEFLRAFANLAGSAIEMARLTTRLSRENVSLQREVQDLRKAAGDRTRYRELVGKTIRMQAIYDMMDRISASTLPVLITGESGTGKELVARALHFTGPRREKRFFTENVAAIPDTLLESELFGHARGAFTGADRDRKGVFEEADGGTLFLDEIGDMSLPLQSKLLRALQDGEVRPLGTTRSVKADVRVISATNRNLEEMVEEGKFREDLYYRLHGVEIRMPPLRERKEDIPILVEHFLSKLAAKNGLSQKKLDISALQLLIRYDWPGNVRELENEVAKLAALTASDVITQQDLIAQPGLFEKLTRLEEGGESFQPLHEVEKVKIEQALALSGGNRAKAAQLLGISRATIYRKIREYAISI